MQNVNDYWLSKEERAKIARQHTEDMEIRFPEEIQKCIKETKIYEYINKSYENNTKKTKIILKNLDSVGAIFEDDLYTNHVAILNFASYKNPGGMFLNGSKAQEECLCHESFLYNVLKEFPDYYKWNNDHKNKALYRNRALYSPNVLFTRDSNGRYCDVITCAAPNKSAAQKYANVSNNTNLLVLDTRINFVLNVAARNNVSTLILGAYGCGVFGQDPYEVAKIFKDYLDGEYKGCFENVVFAIPDGKNGNLKAFKEVFND